MNLNKLPAAVATLKATQLFSGLEDAEITVFAKRTVVRRFSAEELLFSEGEPCQGLYVYRSQTRAPLQNFFRGGEQVLTVGGSPRSVRVFI